MEKHDRLPAELVTTAKLKQEIVILKYELREMRKAIERHRREFSSPMFSKEFGREITLDFDDPLYPYCPYRLQESELLKYIEKGGQYGSKSQSSS